MNNRENLQLACKLLRRQLDHETRYSHGNYIHAAYELINLVQEELDNSVKTVPIWQVTYTQHGDINRRLRYFLHTEDRANEDVERAKHETDHTGQCINSGFNITKFDVPIESSISLACFINEFLA